MRKRKSGFTLIEMLVVIAIIAILVSIIVPTVTASKTKAAAAANAANLRSVKGELSALRITNPDVLSNNLIQNVDLVVRELYGVISGIIQSTPNLQVMRALAESLTHLDEAVAQDAFYAQDGMLELNGISIVAPAAKGISVDGITVPETTQMQVVFTETDIIVTYAGMTAEAFAAIAEGGEDKDYSDVNHAYVDSNKDNVCDICNGSYPHTAEEIADGIIGGVVSGGHTCSDANGDCKCDDSHCNLSAHTDEEGGWLGGDGICDKCGYCTAGCADAKKNGANWRDPDRNKPDGKCDECGKPMNAN